MNPLKQLAIRASFYPSVAINFLLCRLGIWAPWHWVDEHVLLGAIPTRGDIRRLHELGIQSIVNMCEEFAGHEAEMAGLNIRQLRLPTLDYHFPSEAHLLSGLAFIREEVAAGRKVYVHCKAGRGRAATMALCHVMATQRISPGEAFARIRAIRPHLTRHLDRRPPVLAVARRLGLRAPVDEAGAPL